MNQNIGDPEPSPNPTWSPWEQEEKSPDEDVYCDYDLLEEE